MGRRKKDAGSRAGRKNLIRKDDFTINQHKVKFTDEDIRQFRNAVQRVNRKREKMIKAYEGQPITRGKKVLPESREQLRIMGQEMPITIRKRSASLNQFRSKAEFNSYMRRLGVVEARDYEEYRVKLYKKNFMTAIQNNYGEYPDLVKGAIMRIRMMPLHEFEHRAQTDRLFDIREHYSPYGKINTLLALRESLSLRNPDFEEDGDTYY